MATEESKTSITLFSRDLATTAIAAIAILRNCEIFGIIIIRFNLQIVASRLWVQKSDSFMC